MIAADIMTTRPASADVRSSVRAVMQQLMDLDIRHLPIVDEGELVGIVSDRDLRDVTSLVVTEGGARLDRLLNGPVGNVMSADVLSVNSEADVGELVDLMIEHRVGAVPVVSPGTSELVGIVSYVDVLRAAKDEL